MTPFKVGDSPLHFIIVGKPTWRHIRDCRRQARALAAFYPGAPCQIWQGASLRRQIQDSFGEEVTAAFDDLPSSSDAEALASWCLLYLFGGMFHALGLQLLAPMRVPDGMGVAAFNDIHPRVPGWTAIDSTILWSRPGRDEWRLAIDLKVRAWREAPLCLPLNSVVLGRAFGLAAGGQGGRRMDDQWVGQVRAVPGTAGAEARAFVAPDGTIVALPENA